MSARAVLVCFLLASAVIVVLYGLGQRFFCKSLIFFFLVFPRGVTSRLLPLVV